MQYFFRLGKNPNLSYAEIVAYLENEGVDFKVDFVDESILIASFGAPIVAEAVINALGGTIKIGRLIGFYDKLDELHAPLLEELGKIQEKKHYGISILPSVGNISAKQALQLGLSIKKQLEGSARLVTSKEKELSSVIVKNEKLLTNGGDFNLFKIEGRLAVGITEAVQDFKAYSFRDYDRPAADSKSGMIPPKLAQIMINLVKAPKESLILDPFCGSGTILQELLLKGYKNLIGSDIAEKAIDNSKTNLEWLEKNFPDISLDHVQLHQYDVRQMNRQIKDVDFIITEPYLGPALRGKESFQQLEKIKQELEELYMETFKSFNKIMKSGGRVAIVSPVFKYIDELIYLDIFNKLRSYGFTLQTSYKSITGRQFRYPLMYYREDQRVYREILVFQKG